MKRTLLFITFSAILSFSGCKKDRINNLNSISYGSSFGMCVGYCSNNLLISDLKLTFSKSKNGQTSDTKTCSKTISEADVNAIKNDLNMEKIAALPETIGCPDCADGGAEWIAINADGKQYKITYEYGKAPKELEAAVARLKVLKDGFKDCN
ncbi:hypothetical protein G7074_05790 [Pedobacter sp. HDW13]|uniref:hypothetical protein n=1 Tax=unclassified Pedobacter TaxID=2628915 RepID=UPI000F59DDBC|nr:MULTISPECIES: hypothetical protein [unclassified Pedobacter]QIL38838.1 hypothetical protein G7074_05790 [Pedobacter sp. HDW13]RQO67257.1 hypothetical protein DBR40_21150 [Pedobacter sp. KBW01]